MYCRQCGHEIAEGSVYCTNCAAPVNDTPIPRVGKNRVVVGLIALFLGSLGIHNFYLGYTNKGLTQLLVSLVGGLVSCGIATIAMQIWALIEAIQIFSGSISVDANGVPLRD